DVVQTLASPRRLLELVVEHEDALRIDENDPASVADLPEGVRLTKARASTAATV
ncbi:MAG: hypothetical protein GTO30_21135, partial [Acidobacteria bacterium]|nr:hypothetical protein [Acidobacteriota bacterium]NIQ84870.1 hypothetical protein [Acidobacteriota bacterium]